MEKTNNFSIGRMWQYIRFDFLSNGKSYRHRITLIAIILLLIMVLTSIFLGGQDFGFWGSAIDNYSSVMAKIASFMLYVIVAIALSLICEPMKTIGNRINHLMLPASRTEKFVGRLLIVTVGIIVAFFVALLLAECVRNLALLSFGNRYYDVIGFSYLDILEDMYNTISLDWAITGSAMFSLAAYLLGGTIWYNYSFIKTYCVKTIIGLAIFIIFGICSVYLIPLFINYEWPDWLTAEALHIMYGTFMWVGTIAMAIGAYLIYRKAQIATKRYIFKQ